MAERDIAVIGAGIVGLACAYHLHRRGHAVTLIDPDPDGDKASYGNAGGIAVTEVMPASVPGLAWRAAGWMLDPLGPISVRARHAPRLLPWLGAFAKAGRPAEVTRISAALAQINARTYDDLLPMLAAAGLSGELQRTGALSVYETPIGFARDAAEWARKRALGITAEPMSGDAARAIEPALGPRVHAAIWTPDWSQVSDPAQLVMRFARWLAGQGVRIRRAAVRSMATAYDGSIAITLSDGEAMAAHAAVVAAGAWSAALARRLGDRVLLESERGYNMTFPSCIGALRQEVIFAERKFVAASLACGLRIGGAAEFGGLDAVPDYRRSVALVTQAKRYLPGLDLGQGVAWAGHRPTTPDSLPVIGRARRHPAILYAFGHGHLGLTQAATTGRLIGELVSGAPPSIDLAPFAAQRFVRATRTGNA